MGAKVALIPLGKLPTGIYEVKIVGFTKTLKERENFCRPIRDNCMDILACKSFEFSVEANSGIGHNALTMCLNLSNRNGG